MRSALVLGLTAVWLALPTVPLAGPVPTVDPAALRAAPDSPVPPTSIDAPLAPLAERWSEGLRELTENRDQDLAALRERASAASTMPQRRQNERSMLQRKLAFELEVLELQLQLREEDGLEEGRDELRRAWEATRERMAEAEEASDATR